MNSNKVVLTEKSINQLLENFKEFKDGRGHVGSVSRFGPTLGSSIAWLNKFQELFQYKKTCGHCNVQKYENLSLYNWVHRQRLSHKKLELSEERKTLLNSIGFNWAVMVTDRTSVTPIKRTIWLAHFEALKEYKSKYGDDNVPYDNSLSPASSNYYELGKWVQHHSRMHRYMVNGFPTRLSKERFELLKSIGFDQFVHKRSHATKGQNSCDTKIETFEINKVSPSQEAAKEEILGEVTCTKSRIETTNEREVELEKGAFEKGADSCRDNYKLFVPTRDERNYEKSESEIRNVVRPNQEDVGNRQQNEQQIDIVVEKEGEIKHQNDNVVGEYKTYNLTNEPNKERIENELYSEQEERYCGQHMEQITVDANLKEAHQKETTSERRVEMEHEQNLKEKVQILCKLSIMFRKEKNAVYSSIKKRKIDNSLTLNDSKRHRK